MNDEGARDISAGEPANNTGNASRNPKRLTLQKILAVIYIGSIPVHSSTEFVTSIIITCVMEITGPVGLFYLIGFALISKLLPIATLVIGVTYRDQEKYCPAGPIPLLLIIGGSIHLAQWLHGYLRLLKLTKSYRTQNATQKEGGVETDKANSTEPQESQPKMQGPYDVPVDSIDRILDLAETVWFFTSCIFVYPLYFHVNYEESSPTENYCHHVPYQFAFWFLTLSFIVVGLIFVVGIWACNSLRNAIAAED